MHRLGVTVLEMEARAASSRSAIAALRQRAKWARMASFALPGLAAIAFYFAGRLVGATGSAVGAAAATVASAVANASHVLEQPALDAVAAWAVSPGPARGGRVLLQVAVFLLPWLSALWTMWRCNRLIRQCPGVCGGVVVVGGGEGGGVGGGRVVGTRPRLDVGLHRCEAMPRLHVGLHRFDAVPPPGPRASLLLRMGAACVVACAHHTSWAH
jgi:hypothetical protein